MRLIILKRKFSIFKLNIEKVKVAKGYQPNKGLCFVKENIKISQFHKCHRADSWESQIYVNQSGQVTGLFSVKMNICSEYKKSFGRAGALKMHTITHSKEKIHACVLCQKSFG